MFRLLTALAIGLASLPLAAQQLPAFAEVRPGVPLRFPRDHGAHPAFRTEWWYITGWLEGADRPMGFQITFFRHRPAVDQRNPSRFTARQILFAHAAVSDAKVGRLLHAQRIARAGFGLARAATTDTDVRLDDWRLQRVPDGRFIAHVRAREFAFDVVLRPTQAILLQGQYGYSRKGPLPLQASHYYTLPHLEVSGTARVKREKFRVRGRAWLDREWSSTLLDPRAVGWDWVGLNLDDGGALTAFQVRDVTGRPLWSGGSLRDGKGKLSIFGRGDVMFTTVRWWRSARTAARYPVERVVIVRTGSGARRFHLRPLFDDQELDSRAGGGPVYWEGAVRADSGRGYLELTGYAGPLRL